MNSTYGNMQYFPDEDDSLVDGDGDNGLGRPPRRQNGQFLANGTQNLQANGTFMNNSMYSIAGANWRDDGSVEGSITSNQPYQEGQLQYQQQNQARNSLRQNS